MQDGYLIVSGLPNGGHHPLGGSRPSRLLTRAYATKPSRNWEVVAESPARMVGRPFALKDFGL
jgi:hypothetical protein